MARTRSDRLGPASRPVALPEDLDDPAAPKAPGVVEVPLHIRWSYPSISYDLSKRRARLRVHEQVLREGSEEDVRFYVRLDELVTVVSRGAAPSAPLLLLRNRRSSRNDEDSRNDDWTP